MKTYDPERAREGRILFWLVLAIGLLVALCMQSYFDYECKFLGAQAANLSVRGVMCSYELNGYTKFISLEELQGRHDEKLKLEECIKQNPDNTAVCDPRYIPPVPTVKIETG